MFSGTSLGERNQSLNSTKATSDLIAVLSEEGGTIAEVQRKINYDEDAKAVLQAYIDRGYGDVEAREWFKY